MWIDDFSFRVKIWSLYIGTFLKSCGRASLLFGGFCVFGFERGNLFSKKRCGIGRMVQIGLPCNSRKTQNGMCRWIHGPFCPSRFTMQDKLLRVPSYVQFGLWVTLYILHVAKMGEDSSWENLLLLSMLVVFATSFCSPSTLVGFYNSWLGILSSFGILNDISAGAVTYSLILAWATALRKPSSYFFKKQNSLNKPRPSNLGHCKFAIALCADRCTFPIATDLLKFRACL